MTMTLLLCLISATDLYTQADSKVIEQTENGATMGSVLPGNGFAVISITGEDFSL